LAKLDKSLHHCALEATGNYGALLVEMLVESDISVSVLDSFQEFDSIYGINFIRNSSTA